MNAVQDETTTVSFDKLPDLKSEPRFRVRVRSNERVAPEVIVLSLERPAEFSFTPGQYVWLVLPKRSARPGVIDRRAYSISSGTQSANLELLIRLTGSDYLKDVAALKADEEVDIIGPMGSVFVAPETGAILLAGGTGVAPFLSILRSGVSGEFSLIAFESKERLLHYKAELEELRQRGARIARCAEGPPQRNDFTDITDSNDRRPILIA